ncbi:MAG: AlpA family phage regulatory protein [Acidobacteriota bacterium]|nr:AlpA family phage regulatory protein [Acidobacteriota bacterium]
MLRLPAVQQRVGLSRSSIYLAVQNRTFPAPIKLGARSVGWLSSSVNGWLSDRIDAARNASGSAERPDEKQKSPAAGAAG